MVKSISIDLSGLDRSSILRCVRSAYRAGYAQIHLSSKNTDTPHLRKAHTTPVQDAVREEIGKLIGAQLTIINARKYIVTIKNSTPTGTYQIVTSGLKKIVQMDEELLLLFKGHLYAAPMLEEGHNAITKLVSFGLRELMLSPSKEAIVLGHMLECIDKIADFIKYLTRDYVYLQQLLGMTALRLFQEIHALLLLCDKVYAKPTNANITEFSVKRDEVKRHMQGIVKNMNPQETYLFGQAIGLLEVLVELIQARILLGYQK